MKELAGMGQVRHEQHKFYFSHEPTRRVLCARVGLSEEEDQFYDPSLNEPQILY